MSARSVRRSRERQAGRERRRASTRTRWILGLGSGAVLLALAGPATAGAATFTVTKTADTDGPACVASDSDCSLREALKAANSNDESNIIDFAAGVTGTSTLDPALGDLDIQNDPLEIHGPGAGVLTISGGDQSRIFNIFGADGGDQPVVISGLTLTHGNPTGTNNQDGGAILNTDGGSADGGGSDFGPPANLTVADSVISASIAFRGGGIANEIQDSNSSGALTIQNTTIKDNTAERGGGVFTTSVGKPVTISTSTFSGNNALAPQVSRAASQLVDGDGGGLAVEQGTAEVVVQDSTFAKNHADTAGGGNRFVSEPTDARTVRNSTIADNSAGEGGGISVSRSFTDRAGRGGDVVAPVNLSSTIVADNEANSAGGNADGPDLKSDNGSYNVGFSLIEITNGASITAAPPGSNITGQDPALAGLVNNGGPTETKLPAASSLAIDSGVANGLGTDQRGLGRTIDRPPANQNGSDGTDIGAVELAADEQPVVPGPKETRCLGEQFLVKRGTAKGEKIEGTPDRDGIFAHAGGDTVLGLEDDDCLFGGTQDDNLKGNEGDDRVNGDPDDDSVHGNDGRDDVRGQHGDDHVYGGSGPDNRVTGGAGDDHVFAGPGDDKLVKGDGGDDVIDLGSGNDWVHAGGGRDVIHADDGEVDRIICGAGHDVAFVDSGDSVNRDCNTVHVVH